MRPRIAVYELDGYHYVVVGTPKAAIAVQVRPNGQPCNVSLEAGHDFGLDGYEEYGPLVEADNTDSALPIQEAEAAFQDPGEAAELVPGVDYELPGEAEGVDLDVPVDESGCEKETL